MRLPPLSAAILLAAGCAQPRSAEDPSAWYSDGQDLFVTEPVEFTDEPYGDLGAPDTIGDLVAAVFPTGTSTYVNPVLYGQDELIPDNACDWDDTADLPMTVEGVVTAHPRFYFKTVGCDGDEKYYGCYFLEDDEGGVFVLGDSKVAHFDMGDEVRMLVRGARTSFALDMVYAHDVVSVERVGRPIHYEEPTGPLGAAHIARVQRVTGEVVTELGQFGDFQVDADGQVYDIQLDAELSRRGVSWPVGARVTVTGPVLYSYSVYSIVVTRVGQVEVHD